MGHVYLLQNDLRKQASKQASSLENRRRALHRDRQEDRLLAHLLQPLDLNSQLQFRKQCRALYNRALCNCALCRYRDEDPSSARQKQRPTVFVFLMVMLYSILSNLVNQKCRQRDTSAPIFCFVGRHFFNFPTSVVLWYV